MKKVLILLSFFFSVLFFSCRKENDAPFWDVDAFGPIAYTSLEFNDLVADSLLQINGDNSLSVIYNQSLFNFTLDSLFNIPDTSLYYYYNIPLGYVDLNPGDPVLNQTQNVKMNLNSVELNTVSVRSGTMNVKIKSYIREKTVLLYEIPYATKNGQSFKIKVNIPPRTGNAPGTYNLQYSMQGYTIDLKGTSGKSNNTLVTKMQAWIDSNAVDSVRVLPTDSVVIENAFSNMVPQYAKGYFGSNNYLFTDTTDFSISKKIISGNLLLDSVHLIFKIDNSIGVDAQVNLNNLTSINSIYGNSVSLNHSIINNNININRAQDFPGNLIPGTYSTTIHSGNSNIKQLFENLPDKLGYTMNATFNPLGNISGGNDFIYYGTGINVAMNMEIPLHFGAGNLLLSDTVEYNIAVEDENIKYGNLHIYAENGFPLDVQLKLYILNNNYAIVDSIIPVPDIILKAGVDANNVVNQITKSKLTFPLTENGMKNLYANKKLIIHSTLNSANYPQKVKIYSNYSLKLKLVGDFRYRIILK